MASLSEMLQYAQAQQPPNPLADITSHFIEGASSGYDAGHAEALKKAEMDATNPVVTTDEGKQMHLDAYSKLLDIKNKLLEHDNEQLLYNTFKQQSGAQDIADRTNSLSHIATNALNAGGAPAGTTVADKVAQVAANPDTAGTPRKPTKTTVEMVGGKPTVKMEYGDAKNTTAGQLNAIRSYVDKPDDPATTAALSAQFPDGMPDWATKFMAQHSDIKQKQAAIDDAKNQVRQDKLENQYRTAQTSVRGDPTIAHVETQRDAAITAYNRINEIEKSGQAMNPVDYIDVLGQIYKARTGAAPTNEVLADARQQTAKGQVGKVYTYFTGQQAPATTQDIQDSLKNMAASMGSQADKLHAGYMRSRLQPPTGLDPDRAANVEAGRGMSFQEATGYQPEGKGTAATGQGEAPTISSKAEYDALPVGTQYIADGKLHRKK